MSRKDFPLEEVDAGRKQVMVGTIGHVSSPDLGPMSAMALGKDFPLEEVDAAQSVVLHHVREPDIALLASQNARFDLDGWVIPEWVYLMWKTRVPKLYPPDFPLEEVDANNHRPVRRR